MNIQSILILEDTTTVRRWLCGLVMTAFPGCAISEAATLNQAMASIQDQQFDLALIDINLSDGNGITLLSALRQRSPQTYCVIATIFDDDENVFRALQAGAHGYLLKDQQDEKLLASLKGILNNEPPLSPPIALRMLGYFRQPQPAANNSEQTGLSEREREVLTLVAKGMNRAEVARLLDISPATVATHIGAIYRKLKISSRSEAAVEAVRLGLITP